MKFAVYQSVTEEYKRESCEGRAPTYGGGTHQIQVGELHDTVEEALKSLLALKEKTEVVLVGDYWGHGAIKLEGICKSYGDVSTRCGNRSTWVYGPFYIGIVDTDKKERAYRGAPSLKRKLIEMWGFRPSD